VERTSGATRNSSVKYAVASAAARRAVGELGLAVPLFRVTGAASGWAASW
jgi:hypothetical protein